MKAVVGRSSATMKVAGKAKAPAPSMVRGGSSAKAVAQRQTASARAAVGGSLSLANGSGLRVSVRESVAARAASYDQEQFIAESKEMRLKHLEEQAMYALKISCENFDHAVFPNAMIAGDVVITHLLSRLGYLKDGKCKVMVVDTFHLFPETMEFLKEMEVLRLN